MRWEHINLDLSTGALALLQIGLARELSEPPGTGPHAQYVRNELINLSNEIRARLQRRDVDLHAKQKEPT